MPGILNPAGEVTAFSCVVSYPGCPDPPTDVLPALEEVPTECYNLLPLANLSMPWGFYTSRFLDIF